MNRDAFVLTIAFALIFGGYASSEVFVELLQKTRGLDSLGITMMILVYGCFCLGSTVAWRFADRFGTKWSLFGSSLVYTTFVGALNSFTKEALIITSISLGFAASVLWNAYRTHMVLVSEHGSVGRTVSMAEFIRLTAVILASSLLGYLSRLGEFSTAHSFAFILTSAGSLTLLCLNNSFSGPKEKSSPARMLHLFESVTLLRVTSASALTPLIGGLMRGSLPLFISLNLGVDAVGYLNSFLLGGQMVGNIASVRMADKLNKHKLILSGGLLCLVGLAALPFINSSFLVFSLALSLVGVGRAISDNTLAALIADISKDRLSIAHSGTTFMSSLGFLVPLILSLIYSPKVSMILTLLVGSLLYIQLLILLKKDSGALRDSISSEFTSAQANPH